MENIFNNLFGEQDEIEDGESYTPDSTELPTQPYAPISKPSNAVPASLEPFQVGIGISRGMQREHNEDSLFAMSTIMVSNQVSIPLGLFIVADGMGGHEHGEIASELAVQAMAGSVLPEIISDALGVSTEDDQNQLQEIMSRGIHSAHKSIQENAPGGGSTLTGLLVLDNTITIAHIGDSRAYYYDGENDPQVMTTDHSLVKRLEDLGQITPDEAAIHPQRNVLYRALGQVDQVDAEIRSIGLPRSGQLVICSDGLWGVVPDREIASIISSNENPQKACQSLLQAANSAGGPDNISVILIQLPE